MKKARAEQFVFEFNLVLTTDLPRAHRFYEFDAIDLFHIQ